MIYVSLGVEFGFWIEETEFVLSENNGICDTLSRRSETDMGMGAKTATELVSDLEMDPSLATVGGRDQPTWERNDRIVRPITDTQQ